MLDFTDPRWGELSGNYSSDGRDVAEMMRQYEDGALEQDEQDDLWQEMLSQGTPSTAGYAAVPHLLRWAESADALTAFYHVMWAASILSASQAPDADPVPAHLVGDMADAYPKGLRLAQGLLTAAEWDEDTARFLLAAIATFLGHHRLHNMLEAASLEA